MSSFLFDTGKVHDFSSFELAEPEDDYKPDIFHKIGAAEFVEELPESVPAPLVFRH